MAGGIEIAGGEVRPATAGSMPSGSADELIARRFEHALRGAGVVRLEPARKADLFSVAAGVQLLSSA